MAPQLWKEDKAASSCEDKKFTEEGETTEKRLIMVINLMDYLCLCLHNPRLGRSRAHSLQAPLNAARSGARPLWCS
jgi:hypothetical protein